MTQPREKRLCKAKEWLLSQNFTKDTRLIKAYRKHFKVDKLCTIRELGMLGILNTQQQAEYEAQWRRELNNRTEKKRHNDYDYYVDQGNNFFFIADHTSGGVPYGITWDEEMEFEEAEEKVQELRTISKILPEHEADVDVVAVNDEIEKIEALLEAPYCIIDILPKQVQEDSGGQYFSIEKYFLTEPQHSSIKQRHANVILKLNCYMNIFVEGEINPNPKSIVKAVKTRHIDVVLDNALITNEPDDTYMTVYNANEELLELLTSIATSEGLFVWKLMQD